MGTTAWISSAAVAALVAGAGGFAYYNSTCDTCLISSMLGHAETQTVAADAPAESGCCALGDTKAETVLAAQETTEESGCCAEGDAETVLASNSEDCCAEGDECCEDGCEDGCETEKVTEELATSESTEAGNG